MIYLFTEPNPPTDVVCKQTLDTSIVISWNAPSHPYGHIKHYQITIVPSRNDGSDILNTTTNKTEMVVDGLSPGKKILSVILHMHANS